MSPCECWASGGVVGLGSCLPSLPCRARPSVWASGGSSEGLARAPTAPPQTGGHTLIRWSSLESRVLVACSSWPANLTPWFPQDDDGDWDTRSEAAVEHFKPPGYIKNCIRLLGRKRFAEADPTAKAQIGKIELFLAQVCVCVDNRSIMVVQYSYADIPLDTITYRSMSAGRSHLARCASADVSFPPFVVVSAGWLRATGCAHDARFLHQCTRLPLLVAGRGGMQRARGRHHVPLRHGCGWGGGPGLEGCMLMLGKDGVVLLWGSEAKTR